MLTGSAALSHEVRRTLADIDELEGQIKKARTAIEKAQVLTMKYRARLAGLCGIAAAGEKMPSKRQGNNGRGSNGNGNGTQKLQQTNRQEELT